MSFKIQLMQNLQEKECVFKVPDVIKEVDGTLRAETSLIDPVITFNGKLEDFINCNYMYVESFGRYYFVNEIESIRTNLIALHCHVDVLMSWHEQIYANQAIIRRSASNWNLYLDDGSFRVFQNPSVITKAFPSGFTVQNFVLAVAGG